MSKIQLKDKEIYRPSELKISDTDNGGFEVIDVDLDGYQLAILFEFNPINSDLTPEMAREFAEFLIGYYNHNYS